MPPRFNAREVLELLSEIAIERGADRDALKTLLAAIRELATDG